MDQESSVVCLPSNQCDYVVFTEPEAPQSDQSDQLHSEFHHKQTEFGDLTCSDASNPNDGETEDPENGQQWTQVGRSNSGRHSNKKRIKNSNSQEFSQFSGPQNNQGFRRTGLTNGPNSFPNSDSSYGARYRNRPYDNSLGVNGQSLYLETNRTEINDKTGSVTADARLSSSQMMPYGQNYHTSYDPNIERPPYRHPVRYRGRPSFRPVAETDHGTVGCPTTIAPTANGSFGRVPRSSYAPSNVAPQVHPAPRRPHYSMPFTPRVSTSYCRYNLNPPPKPYSNPLRSNTSGSNSLTNPPDVRVSAPAIATPAPTTTPTEETQPIQSVGEQKATWAATVAASPRSRLDEKCNGMPQMTAGLFLSNQWRLFCEQQQQQQQQQS